MQVYPTMKVIVLLLVTCELCWTIRVPVTWDESDSDENQDSKSDELVFAVESLKPQGASEAFKTHDEDSEESNPRNSGESIRVQNKEPIPIEYFQYTAKKPQFAVDVAAFHGVQSPENHYKAYPIRPYTGKTKPELGKHHILDNRNTIYKPFQEFTKINENINHANPVSSNYEVFHPYEAEKPALQEMYKDPVLTKIRNDLENSRSRLQQYEKDSAKPDVTQDEYLESPQRTDSKLFPHKQKPAPFEIHRPQRRPVYYRPGPIYKSREQYLNQKLRHPWNHNIAKVRPMHYRPIQNHIHKLRQSHALKYDDERNEYPEVQILEKYSDPKEGYDIYGRGKDKFVQLRNNVDESLNKVVTKNRPLTYEKLEVQDNDSVSDEDEDDDEEFVPIKNYAQVRRTETFKHLPRAAALEDAKTYDEIKNSPRLREAVKSTKAQTVYSEEGYEDAAYDHAGEQKHASENEGHGGFLKENELSGGKYKAPSVSAKFEDDKGSLYKDKLIHAEKWEDINKDTKEESDEEEYAEDEHEHLLEADNHQIEPQNEANHRNKRENNLKNDTIFSSHIQSDYTSSEAPYKVLKPQIHFEVPQIDLNSTFFKDSEYLKLANLEVVPKKDNIRQKYPYYFKHLKTISKNSPLRYAENLKLIPKKSKGGTEFYDSRSKYECSEVEDVPDPVPEKLKGDGHPEESNANQSSENGDENFDTTKKQPRLKGLGDKIDCFKAKFFGENPLDSPFFKEDIIPNPEPVFLPSIAAYKQKIPSFLKRNINGAESNVHNVFEKFQDKSNLFGLIEKLRSDHHALQSSTAKPNNTLVLTFPERNLYYNSNNSQFADQSSVYGDIIKNIKASLINSSSKNDFHNITEASITSNQSEPTNNITYIHFQNKEDIITISPISRKKRAAPFVYEPYKIIKDSFIQDDLKKSTVTSNISPLIKQLQSSKVIDTVVRLHPQDSQQVKRNANTRAYKNINHKDREIKYGSSKNDKSYDSSEIVDVSIDKRRGEPRYEIKHKNHKPNYTPIANIKSMTNKEYESKMSSESDTVKSIRRRRPTNISKADATIIIPQKVETHDATAPRSLRLPVSIMTSTLRPTDVSSNYDNKEELDKYSENDEDYDEYDEDNQENGEKIYVTSTTTTSTTSKPVLRRKSRPQTTTQEHLEFIEEPRLKLVTRFRDFRPKDNHEKEYIHKPREKHIPQIIKKPIAEIESHDEKIREKKKKLTKSTLVTDTKRYGDAVEGDEKLMKDEVDALIGVRHDMDDYVPLYEKDEEHKSQEKKLKKLENKKHMEDSDEAIDVDEYEDENEDDEDEEDEISDEDEDEDDDDSDSSIDDEEDITYNEKESLVTTPEPTKRTLVITTDVPSPTKALRSAKLQAKPIITRKKIEIHNELPVNKSSPNITEFKQDIKEIEIIKETRNPLKRRLNKNVEALDLYKDDNLAKDINKLGVEIFKENLDLRQGPKHGGNYRSVVLLNTVPTTKKPKHSKNDAETSQSKYTKHIDDHTPTNTNQNSRNEDENSELLELRDSDNTELRRGNSKYRVKPRNNNEKSQKLIELDDEHEEDSSSNSQEENSNSNLRRRRPMHGGNYRSARLTEEKPHTTTETNAKRQRDERRNAALVLSSFVQAVPIMTTTPAYILDPSKRKYYYVDA